ncbi:YckD family protein [Aquibacillus sediminis]|uniref:YckD family protein n=1 Tax=Aquibacillus sediminis TaxID=2574734 RepID=UPI001109F763|nr:YckD family protein [Aquibacillus sediminis]
MRNLIKTLLTVALMATVVGVGSMQVNAEEEQDHKSYFNDVELTEQQKTELEALYQDVINRRKGIINKYEEFGVIDEDKAEKMKAHLDEFYEKLKEDEFVPKWDKKHKGKHKHD